MANRGAVAVAEGVDIGETRMVEVEVEVVETESQRQTRKWEAERRRVDELSGKWDFRVKGILYGMIESWDPDEEDPHGDLATMRDARADLLVRQLGPELLKGVLEQVLAVNDLDDHRRMEVVRQVLHTLRFSAKQIVEEAAR